MQSVTRFLRKCHVHNFYHGISGNMRGGRKKSINAEPTEGETISHPSKITRTLIIWIRGTGWIRRTYKPATTKCNSFKLIRGEVECIRRVEAWRDGIRKKVNCDHHDYYTQTNLWLKQNDSYASCVWWRATQLNHFWRLDYDVRSGVGGHNQPTPPPSYPPFSLSSVLWANSSNRPKVR